MSNFFNFANIIGLILLVLGIVWLIYTLWKIHKIDSIPTWPKANARIINVFVAPENDQGVYVEPQHIHVGPNSHTRYIPKILYSYRVGGREYQSSNLVYDGPESFSAVDTKAMVGQMRPGSEIQVFYNPKNPAESYVYNGNKSWIGPILGIATALVGILLLLKNNTTWFGSKSIDSNNKAATTSKTTTANNARIQRVRNEANNVLKQLETHIKANNATISSSSNFIDYYANRPNIY
jgi:hypothetical protein